MKYGGCGVGVVVIVVVAAAMAEELSEAQLPHRTSQGDLVSTPRSLSQITENLSREDVTSPKDSDLEEDLNTGGKMRMVKNFLLWTRSNAGSESYESLDPFNFDTITKSSFRARQTYIIIHGFLGWGKESWILTLKDKLLNLSDSNVISVDWPAGTAWFLPTYYIAVNRVPSVGWDCVQLLSALANITSLSTAQVHFIGHSLGAHVSGLAAKRVQGKIGRISGLDPAGLMYRRVLAKYRLDASDATYVDIVHTNGCYTALDPWGDCFGLNENIGHSDFWPNGGEHQPSCSSSNGEIGCSHEMAYRYYIESIDYGQDLTFFLARPCSSFTTYKSGNCSCGESAQYMGFNVNTELASRYYLATNPYSPYAREDSSCSPGTHGSASAGYYIIAGSGLAGAVVVCGTVAVAVQINNKRKERIEDCSGLVVQEETQTGNSEDEQAFYP